MLRPNRNLLAVCLGAVFITLTLTVAARSAEAGEPGSEGEPESELHSPRTRNLEDSDADGVPNDVERRTNTDPDVPGLFPGSYPHIPEPLYFDLVRGLGAKRGEFEFNVLTTADFRPYGGVGWAPEVEWAFADRYAIEFEIPMHDGRLEALKLAQQGTFRERRPNFIHGWQVIVEGKLEGVGEFTALYLAGRRFGRRTSMLAMLGPRVAVDSSETGAELLVNPSVFVDIDERFTIGLENNAVIDGRDSSLRSLPQLHLQLGRHTRVQVGGGVEVSEDGLRPAVGIRLVIE